MKSANGNATNRKKEGTSKQSFVYYGKKKKMQTKQTQICSTLSLISTVYVCLAHTKNQTVIKSMHQLQINNHNNNAESKKK